jgi:hypothetical protein
VALNTKTAVAIRNSMLDQLGTAVDSGFLRIYDGSQPADADTALSGQTLLAELTFGADAFPAASGGVLTANAITSDASANATGTAAWCRILKTDGTTVLFDGTVGVGASFNLNVNTTSFVVGAVVAVSSLTYTLGA